MISNCEHHFMCWVVICMSFWINVYSISLLIYKSACLVLSLSNYGCYLYIVGTDSLWGILSFSPVVFWDCFYSWWLVKSSCEFLRLFLLFVIGWEFMWIFRKFFFIQKSYWDFDREFIEVIDCFGYWWYLNNICHQIHEYSLTFINLC